VAIPAPSPRVLSVGEVTFALRDLVAASFGEVLVRGEVTGLRKAAAGHLYFTLKDAQAVLPCVLWRSTVARMKFRLDEGIEVVCRGGVDVYPPHGKYQLIVQEVSPLGVGALQLAFEQVRKRLEAEGLFDPARKIALPSVPRRVCLVTSRSGAAVRDLATVIHRRFPRVEIVLVNVRVQGPGAAEEIARGLALADARAAADVIVVGRGGGSLEDLWAFNEEVVARAIAACVTPIVSAVGHEIDVTIADLVADVRAATPSQAGELVVPVRADLLADLDGRRGRLAHLVRVRVDRAWQRIEAAAGRPVLRDPLSRIAAVRRGLDHLAARLHSAGPAAELARRRESVVNLSSRAALAARHRVQRAFASYEARRAQVEALSPLRVLDRGYSLTRTAAGALLKSVAQAKPGDRLVTEVNDGRVESRVEAVRPADRAP
jgi:exodeoxyribonuclease VII large subunit